MGDRFLDDIVGHFANARVNILMVGDDALVPVCLMRVPGQVGLLDAVLFARVQDQSCSGLG